MDLLESLRRPDFDTLDHRTLEEGICLQLALSIDTIVTIDKPVEELESILPWDKLDNFDDVILRKTIGRIFFPICGGELQLSHF